MKNYDFFPGEGKFYKANLHCHTVLSDGRLTKEEIKAAYQAEGYSIVAYTDHRTYGYHPELTDERFVALAAIEIDLNQTMAEGLDWNHCKTYHLNFYDQAPKAGKAFPMPDFPYEDIDALNRYIADRNAEGFLCCYNHPYWSLQNYDDYKDLKGLFAMEIYNHGCEHDGLYGYNPQSYDEMLRTGQRLYAVATDDNHNGFPFDHPMSDSFGGYVMVKLPKLTYADTVEALKEGRFYFSMGPEIHEARIEDNVLTVKTSPVQKIYLVGDGRNYEKLVMPSGESVTEASFPLTGEERWLHIVVRDEKGLYAGTNPCFFD